MTIRSSSKASVLSSLKIRGCPPNIPPIQILSRPAGGLCKRPLMHRGDSTLAQNRINPRIKVTRYPCAEARVRPIPLKQNPNATSAILPRTSPSSPFVDCYIGLASGFIQKLVPRTQASLSTIRLNISAHPVPLQAMSTTKWLPTGVFQPACLLLVTWVQVNLSHISIPHWCTTLRAVLNRVSLQC
ncbi:hypothetical protein BDM02DRAFT_319515 [Thelephora ganbajun]|uniref:Uncharacterized protein n=1 Tax=Thelephora ganbajun TaxID=370292 RepID=A0ACB6Z960_THEGA|nr:hypothetical protein BDM02DRAFT_319515 [Thelephora ganbajun]